MRNKLAGPCYYCRETVAIGAGHFERRPGGWRTIHAYCVVKQRAEKACAVLDARATRSIPSNDIAGENL